MSVTVRQVYEAVSLEIDKFKVPSFYVKDFVYYFNKSIRDVTNELCALYEKNQQLSDDLENIQRHIIININDDVPFPLNIEYSDGTPFISFSHTFALNSMANSYPSHLVEGLNPSPSIPNGDFRYYSENLDIVNTYDNIIVNKVFTTGFPDKILDQLILGDGISDGVIIKFTGGPYKLRDYRFAGNSNSLIYGFNLIDQDTIDINSSYSDVYVQYNAGTKMFDLLKGSGYKKLDDRRLLIHAPSDYLHILGMDNIVEFKNSIECEKVFSKYIPVKRLTAERKNTIKTNSWLDSSVRHEQNYYKEINNLNSTYPDFEIEYCSEKEKLLVQLIKVEFQYLREPTKYVLSDDDLDGPDNTAIVEFQDYMIDNFILKLVNLFLEKHGNPRLQTYQPVNDSNKRSREEN